MFGAKSRPTEVRQWRVRPSERQIRIDTGRFVQFSGGRRCPLGRCLHTIARLSQAEARPSIDQVVDAHRRIDRKLGTDDILIVQQAIDGIDGHAHTQIIHVFVHESDQAARPAHALGERSRRSIGCRHDHQHVPLALGASERQLTSCVLEQCRPLQGTDRLNRRLRVHCRRPIRAGGQ